MTEPRLNEETPAPPRELRPERGKGRRLAAKLGIALASLALALAGVEWVLRLTYPVLGAMYRLDHELLFATIPGSGRVQIMPEHAGGSRHRIRINSTGYRGPELERDGKRPRIAVIGDSLVLAGNVAQGATLPVRLAERFGDRFEVVNCGLEGYGPDQSLLKLETELEALEPVLVVLVLCATNDYGDLLRNKLFRVDDADRLANNRHAFSDRVVAFFGENHERSQRPALWRAWKFYRDYREGLSATRETRVAPSLDHYIGQYLTSTAWEYQNAVIDKDPLVHNLFADTYDADIAIQPDAPSAVYKRRLMRAVLARLATSCAAADVPLAAIVVPSAVDIDPSFHLRVDPGRFPTYDPRALSDAFVADLEAANIAGLDLFDSFAENEPSELFVGGEDIHWNERGIDLAAGDIVHWLEALGVVPD